MLVSAPWRVIVSLYGAETPYQFLDRAFASLRPTTAFVSVSES